MQILQGWCSGFMIEHNLFMFSSNTTSWNFDPNLTYVSQIHVSHVVFILRFRICINKVFHITRRSWFGIRIFKHSLLRCWPKFDLRFPRTRLNYNYAVFIFQFLFYEVFHITRRSWFWIRALNHNLVRIWLKFDLRFQRTRLNDVVFIIQCWLCI